MRAVVHSTKHYVQTTLSSALTVARNLETIVQSVEGTVANQATEVVEGAIVKAVYVELWVIGTTADQFFTIILSKDPSGLAGATFTQMTDLNSWTNKKNILYTTQGLASNDGIAMPVPILRQWIKIPKSKQRFGLGDKLRLAVASRGDSTINYCGFYTYKEYT